jgi:TetR/AcrR family transcriptional regulator
MVEQARKRGRVRVYDAQKSREAMLNAAEALFAEHGYHGASMDAIAKAAGYNKSLLFQYFGDKLSLYAAVLERADGEMSALLAAVFAPLHENDAIASNASLFREFLATTFGAVFDYMVEHPRLMRIFNWEQAEGSQTLSQLASHFEPDDLSRFEKLFSQARLAGLVRPELDVVVMVPLLAQVSWSIPAGLPLYQLALSRRDFSSDSVLVHLRDQVIALLIAWVIPDSAGESR